MRSGQCLEIRQLVVVPFQIIFLSKLKLKISVNSTKSYKNWHVHENG